MYAGRGIKLAINTVTYSEISEANIFIDEAFKLTEPDLIKRNTDGKSRLSTADVMLIHQLYRGGRSSGHPITDFMTSYKVYIQSMKVNGYSYVVKPHFFLKNKLSFNIKGLRKETYEMRPPSRELEIKAVENLMVIDLVEISRSFPLLSTEDILIINSLYGSKDSLYEFLLDYQKYSRNCAKTYGYTFVYGPHYYLKNRLD